MKIANCTVKSSQKEKLLGVLIDTNLSFEKHMRNIFRKVGNKLLAQPCGKRMLIMKCKMR